jgi:hypothetical protein
MDERQPPEGPGHFPLSRRTGLLLLGAVILFALIGYAAMALLPSGEGPEPPATPQPEQAYEEPIPEDGPGLDELVKRVDFALLSAFTDMGLNSRDYALETVEGGGRGEPMTQRIAVHAPGSPEELADRVAKHLDLWAPMAVLNTTPDGLRVSLKGRNTHIVRLGPPLPPPVEPPPDGALLAVVIDDLGEDLSFAESLAELPFPVSIAVWPQATHTRGIAATAREKGLDLLLHQPMEPRGWPKVRPGPGALMLSMNATEARRVLNENLDGLPGVVGLNNHMGSRYTSDRAAMDLVATTCAERGLIFLDSRTVGGSKGKEAAVAAGLAPLERDVFLDNVPQTPAILHQLRKAERLALKRGQAVAIGHPHPETLEALRQWWKMRDPAVTPVGIASMAERLRRTTAKKATSHGSDGEG